MTQSMPPVSRPPSGPANGGTITGQQRTVEPGPNNTVVPGYRVEFTTGKGLSGSVFIPESGYTQANAVAAARAQANLMDGVHGASI